MHALLLDDRLMKLIRYYPFSLSKPRQMFQNQGLTKEFKAGRGAETFLPPRLIINFWCGVKRSNPYKRPCSKISLKIVIQIIRLVDVEICIKNIHVLINLYNKLTIIKWRHIMLLNTLGQFSIIRQTMSSAFHTRLFY